MVVNARPAEAPTPTLADILAVMRSIRRDLAAARQPRPVAGLTPGRGGH